MLQRERARERRVCREEGRHEEEEERQQNGAVCGID